MCCAVALALLLALLVPGPSAPQADAADSGTRTYAPTAADLANPDRGMYHHTESHARSDGSGSQPLELGTLRAWRQEQLVTVVYRVYYLERFVARPLDAEFLAGVAADLATARAGGVKLVLRFAYTDASGADAGPVQVLAHIDQLAPVLARDADVVLALQAGLVGRWGEWYYSDHFTDDPARPWLLSAASWTRRLAVLHRLLRALPPSIALQVRYPEIKDRLTASAPALTAGRVIGIHNDCFVADDTDSGTFGRPADRLWLARETLQAPMGGETCRVNAPRSSWENARRDLAAYHWSFLNLDYHREVLGSWGVAGQAEVRRRLGYRIRLTETSAPRQLAPGAPFTFRARFANDGYAAPLGAYDARLVLRSGSTTVVRPLRLDLRTVVPGRITVVDATLAAPPQPGRYTLYLQLRPHAPALAGRPDYAVQLANEGTWRPSQGWNDLLRTVTVVNR